MKDLDSLHCDVPVGDSYLALSQLAVVSNPDSWFHRFSGLSNNLNHKLLLIKYCLNIYEGR